MRVFPLKLVAYIYVENVFYDPKYYHDTEENRWRIDPRTTPRYFSAESSMVVKH